MACDLSDRIPDLVVVLDGVERLPLHPGRAVRGQPHLQQDRVEDGLLGRRVQLEERSQPVPDPGQHPGIRPVDLLQDREQPPLLTMVIKDQFGDVQRSSLALVLPGTMSSWHAHREPTITHEGATGRPARRGNVAAMPERAPDPQVIPYLLYADAGA